LASAAGRGESIRPPINFSKDRFAFFFSFFLLTFFQQLPQIKLNPCGNAAGTGALDVTPSVTCHRSDQTSLIVVGDDEDKIVAKMIQNNICCGAT
jgi:hypothetical protein